MWTIASNCLMIYNKTVREIFHWWISLRNNALDENKELVLTVTRWCNKNRHYDTNSEGTTFYEPFNTKTLVFCSWGMSLMTPTWGWVMDASTAEDVSCKHVHVSQKVGGRSDRQEEIRCEDTAFSVLMAKKKNRRDVERTKNDMKTSIVTFSDEH